LEARLLEALELENLGSLVIGGLWRRYTWSLFENLIMGAAWKPYNWRPWAASKI
jgi:hypothetical protein